MDIRQPKYDPGSNEPDAEQEEAFNALDEMSPIGDPAEAAFMLTTDLGIDPGKALSYVEEYLKEVNGY